MIDDFHLFIKSFNLRAFIEQQWVSLVAQLVKNLPAMQETQVWSWRWNGYPLWYSCLENPMDRGVWWATVQGVTKSQTRLSDWVHTHISLSETAMRLNTHPCITLSKTKQKKNPLTLTVCQWWHWPSLLLLRWTALFPQVPQAVWPM